MTSRRAQRRRTRERVSVARAPAPGRALERRGVATLQPVSGSALAAAIPRAPGSTEPEPERAMRLERDARWASMLAANFEAGDPARVGYGLLPWWRVARVQVPADLRRDLVVGAGRPLQCYERSLIYALDHSDHEVWLVHGLVTERGRLWPHAWCQISGDDGVIVYDPTPGEFYDATSYYEVLQAVAVAVYEPEQAAARTIAEGNAGPWGAYEQGQPGYALAVQAVASLHDAYARTFPELAAWVQEMRSRDERFDRDLGDLYRGDLLAIPDLLASLVERPELWRSHTPGAPWPYRLRKHPDHARVIFPETT